MSGEKLYFNGVTPKGKYLTEPASLAEVVEALRREGWQAPPEWVLRWTKKHGVDDPKRKPVLEVKRPWDLEETGWAVVFAPDLDRRVKSALDELLERRRKAVGDHSNYYRELTYHGETTYDFVKKHGGKPGMMADPDHLPYYILLVGSPESLPYKFQSELDVNHAVGRICFEDHRDYARYAHSVAKAESRSQPRSQNVVFFATEHENDPATQGSMEYLNQSYASLAAMLGNMEEDWGNREDVDKDEKELFAHLWLLRNDARNFVVFGDPAVRLPGVEEPR